MLSITRGGLLQLAVSLETLSGKLCAFNSNNGEDKDIGIVGFKSDMFKVQTHV